jgi:HPt (histidine-containing phosphotransfer) domain-containing protein
MATAHLPDDPQAAAPAALDTAGAMALLGDNLDLYQQITESYRHEVGVLPNLVNDLLERDDLAEATRVLHTHKGLSMTIGALALAGACRQSELGLKEATKAGASSGSPSLVALKARIRQDIDSATRTTLTALDTFLNAPAAPSSNEPLVPLTSTDLARLAQDISDLAQLLNASDLAALSLHKDIQTRHSGLSQELAPLAQALQHLDFPKAVVQCHILVRELRQQATLHD